MFQQHVGVNKEGCAGGGELLHLLDAYCSQMPPHAAMPPLMRESGRGDGTRLRPRTSKRVMDAGGDKDSSSSSKTAGLGSVSPVFSST